MSALTEQDHQDLEKVATLVAKALKKLRAFEERHGVDITGPALQALTRAEVSLEFVPIEVRQAEKYFEAS